MEISESIAQPLETAEARLIKRCFDLTATVLAIICVLWWVHLLIALAIKLTSRGPVIFRQRRIGRDSEEFTILKYRTMVLNDESDTQVAEADDSRITAIGRFLRRTNLDELPQFINVLQGDMSIVGPRPHMVSEDDDLRRYIPGYEARLNVAPGITGWAAVEGYRGGTRDIEHMKKRVDLDIWYVQNWSLWLDIKIAARTAVRMVLIKL
jgi:lipopolysaccharide/colanic/teichoic acid biosynthesis glycosyltransferase